MFAIIMSRREEGGCSREIPRSKAEISGSNHFLNTQMNGLYLFAIVAISHLCKHCFTPAAAGVMRGGSDSDFFLLLNA